jgi:hypothetical protein
MPRLAAQQLSCQVALLSVVILKPAHLFSHLLMDLVGPPTRLITWMDRCIHWPEAFLAYWVACFGVAALVTSDRGGGGQFTSLLWAAFPLCLVCSIRRQIPIILRQMAKWSTYTAGSRRPFGPVLRPLIGQLICLSSYWSSGQPPRQPATGPLPSFSLVPSLFFWLTSSPRQPSASREVPLLFAVRQTHSAPPLCNWSQGQYKSHSSMLHLFWSTRTLPSSCWRPFMLALAPSWGSLFVFRFQVGDWVEVVSTSCLKPASYLPRSSLLLLLLLIGSHLRLLCCQPLFNAAAIGGSQGAGFFFAKDPIIITAQSSTRPQRV